MCNQNAGFVNLLLRLLLGLISSSSDVILIVTNLTFICVRPLTLLNLLTGSNCTYNLYMMYNTSLVSFIYFVHLFISFRVHFRGIFWTILYYISYTQMLCF